ncbi:DHH family phosphoesterase [Williamsoniiplasma lucivorax]|uniref:Bifunctional oligoribonuclease and PAP phosphatase NrnA n=1 Tax=Williamsoniiplasma lucivorax TaxID=209274 RepID=A0A2S5RF81_9MOLU|nr:bifunctional oligoribonuclease/PAP phosphatase NrnA [Williamsoniiplasma lucivorax]PPE05970.1 bifunctional oligoribonuclease and PAP phosphatase NrnA [Williamsoniiplasma lucivorax]
MTSTNKNMEIIKKIKQAIESYDTIILHRHIIPDGDAYGSQLGLKYLIQNNYPKKKVLAVGLDINYLKFIGSMDTNVADSKYDNALVIVTDCANIERIDDQRFSMGNFLIKLDHHPNTTPYGDLLWVDTSFTSASEMVGYLAQQLNWKISPETGRVIYHGILTDSLRFSISATTPRTLEVAAHLLKSGFDLNALHLQMYNKQFSDLKLQAELMQTANFVEQVGYIVLTDELLKKYHLRYDENGKFANLLSGIDGMEIWITFAIREDQKYRVEFRSKRIPVNELATNWGGGGHKLAAGAIIDNLDQAKLIIQEAQELIKKAG